jgi:hypothetical protein
MPFLRPIILQSVRKDLVGVSSSVKVGSQSGEVSSDTKPPERKTDRQTDDRRIYLVYIQKRVEACDWEVQARAEQGLCLGAVEILEVQNVEGEKEGKPPVRAKALVQG